MDTERPGENIYRDKVFDENLLQFSLELLELLKKIPANSPHLKRTVLDAMVMSSSVAEASIFFKSLNSLPLEKLTGSLDEFLDVCVELSADKNQLDEFLTTLRHLGTTTHFKAWNEFMVGTKTLLKTPAVMSDWLRTVRHLAIRGDFTQWDEIARCLELWKEDVKGCEDFLMTDRHLSALPQFKSWEPFFTAIKILGGSQPEHLNTYLLAVRHAINYFEKPESLKNIFRTIAMAPQYSEAFCFGQLDSKQWLLEEARKVWDDDWGTVFVLAGWIGVLPRFIFDAGIRVQKIRSMDIDPGVGEVAESLNQTEVQKDWLFKSTTLDITKMSYPTRFDVRRKDGSLCELIEAPDVVINTSCEHIEDISSWWSQIPDGTRVILQSNDGFHIGEHVRCFKSLEEFERAMALSRVEYRGEKALADFNRFMLIGRK